MSQVMRMSLPEFKLSLDTVTGEYAEIGTAVGDGGLEVAYKQVADEGDKAATVNEEGAAADDGYGVTDAGN